MTLTRIATILAATSGVALASATVGQGAAVSRPPGVEIDAAHLPFARTTDERLQSFQIGMSWLTGGETWRAYDSKSPGITGPSATVAGNASLTREARPPADLTNPRLVKLAAALAPLYIRYAGTTANTVYFQDNDEPQLAKAPAGFSVVLTRARWKAGLDFAKAINAKVLTGFAVTSGVRDSNAAWTPLTAAPWLAYTKSIGAQIYAAELYNEPNAPNPPPHPQNYSASDYARDFALLRSFVSKADPSLKLAGPGDVVVAFRNSMLNKVTAEQYFEANPRPRFDIVSYHYYPAVAERCAPANSPMGISAEKALSEEWLARPDAEFQKHRILRDRYAPGAPIWITETGAAGCGGTRWQPTFLDTFRYLDQQARLAKQGVGAIFDHELFSGSNGIIDSKTLIPNPDYWAALMWRRLMGTKVLDAGPIRPGLHVYAHCLRGVPGGVALLAINLQDSPASIGVRSGADLYALTAPELQSRTVLLNGRPLAVSPAGDVPATSPVRVIGKEVSLAPTSVNFIALPTADNRVCRR
jgi:hypothetical protein